MVRRGRLVALEGASAAGKTTVVRAVGRTLGWQPLPEAFERLDPAPSLEFGSARELLRLEGTLLAEEARRYHEALRACARGRTVLADTGFFGPLTYTWGLVALGEAPASVARSLERAARSLVRSGSLGLPDLTFYLATTARERACRARSASAEHPRSLARRHEAVGRVERRLFEEGFAASVPGRFIFLRGRARPALLVRQIRARVDATEIPPASRSEALSVLSALRPSRPMNRRAPRSPNR